MTMDPPPAKAHLMTAADLHGPSPEAGPAPLPERHAVTALRLSRLYLVSRRAPAALALLAGLAVLLWSALHWHWAIAGGRAAQLFISLTIETGTAAVIAVTTYGPFGEPERATGRWLPCLRLGAVAALTAITYGALAAGATGGLLPGGTLALLRNLAGFTGIGLLSAAALGGAFGWTGPMAYLLVTEVALTGNPTTPWVWAARPPHDLGSVLCAGLVFAAGTAAITVFGARDSGSHPAPE
jgi:hypothetical protein